MIPVVLSDSDAEAQLRGLRSDPLFTTTKSARSAGVGAGATSALDDELSRKGGDDGGWRLAAQDAEEWSAWLFLQKVEKGLDAENFYVQARRCVFYGCGSAFGLCRHGCCMVSQSEVL